MRFFKDNLPVQFSLVSFFTIAVIGIRSNELVMGRGESLGCCPRGLERNESIMAQRDLSIESDLDSSLSAVWNDRDILL